MLTTNDFLTLTHDFDRYYGQVIGQVALRYQLSKVEVDVLLFLNNNPGHNTARDIVEYRHIAKSYVSKAVELLVQKGFLSTESDPMDRRITHLKIQPSSYAAIQEAHQAQHMILAAIRTGITDQEQLVMETVIHKIKENLKKAVD